MTNPQRERLLKCIGISNFINELSSNQDLTLDEKLGKLSQCEELKQYLSKSSEFDEEYFFSQERSSEEYLRERIVSSLKLCVLSVPLEFDEKVWSNTFCQDVHHSIFLTKSDLQSTISSCSFIDENTLENYVLHILNKGIRPFLYKWHGFFFENTEYEYRNVRSRPITAAKYQREDYMNEVINFKRDSFNFWLYNLETNNIEAMKDVLAPY